MATKKIDELFGLPERMKIIRLFVFNPEKAFDAETIAQKIGIKKSIAFRGISVLKRHQFIVAKKFSKIIGENPKRLKKVSGFTLNPSYQYVGAVRSFLLETSPDGDDVLARFKGVGKLKLLIVSGVFIQNPESRLDILVVGDGMKDTAVSKAIASLESEIGKELHYFTLSSTDFSYRASMNDKLLRDILDFPHQKMLNKLGV